MAEESSRPRSIKIRPSILRKAHITAILSEKRLGEWVEEAIEEKVAREENSQKCRKAVGLPLDNCQ